MAVGKKKLVKATHSHGGECVFDPNPMNNTSKRMDFLVILIIAISTGTLLYSVLCTEYC